MCDNHSFSEPVLVHLLNGELYSQMSQCMIHDPQTRILHFLLSSKSMKAFVISLNRKISDTDRIPPTYTSKRTTKSPFQIAILSKFN